MLLPYLGGLVPMGSQRDIQLLILLVAIAINFPHFAHSYQIFYGSYRQVVNASDTDHGLRRRYLWAGIAVPLFLALWLACAVTQRELEMLRFSANIMAFFVGWHYVKQGYGILMADAAMKRSFLSGGARKALLVNAYACWAAHWLLLNHAIAEQDFAGLRYYTFDAPPALLIPAVILACVTGLWALTALAQHGFAHPDGFPMAGVTAYIASLYVWLFVAFQPAALALVPAFHSLQYLYMVWRLRLNIEAERPDAAVPVSVGAACLALKRASLRVLVYVLSGIGLGFAAFLALPVVLDLYMPYDRELFGDRLFLVTIWLFINIHHFFIDNAMWRRENPHTMRRLFAAH